MKILIFGIGQYFSNRKSQFFEVASNDKIQGFLDNRSDEIEIYEGISVFSPNVISDIEFDRIILMTTYYQEVFEQLEDLGVSRDKILFWEQYRMEKKHGNMCLQLMKVPIQGKSALIISTDLDYNGGSIAAVYVSKVLQDRGYDVCLVAPSCNSMFRKEIMTENLNLVICPALPYISNLEKNVIEKFNIVIVNVFQLIMTACDISKYKPVLWWIHESDWGDGSVYNRIRYQFSAYDNAEVMRKIGIYAVSDVARRAFEKYYPHQVSGLLPYGIPDESNGPLSYSNQSGKFVFAIIGEVSRLKSQLTFLRSANMFLEEDMRDCEFWIIGSCERNGYGGEVRNLAESIYNAKIVGVMSREDLRKSFRQINCIVCPSMQDSLPIVLTEGMMHGKICITSEQTGMAKYVQDGVNGFVCKAGDVVSLYNCMQRAFYLRKNSSKMCKNARKLYEEKFSMDNFGERLEHALQETKQRYYENGT